MSRTKEEAIAAAITIAETRHNMQRRKPWHDNPKRLAIKRLHPDYFTTMHYKDIAEWHCQLVGNSFLLDIPDMAAVIVHSAYSDKKFEDHKQQWLACGERGGVLVSTSIVRANRRLFFNLFR